MHPPGRVLQHRHQPHRRATPWAARSGPGPSTPAPGSDRSDGPASPHDGGRPRAARRLQPRPGRDRAARSATVLRGLDGATSGERGNVKITEVLWSGVSATTARGETRPERCLRRVSQRGRLPHQPVGLAPHPGGQHRSAPGASPSPSSSFRSASTSSSPPRKTAASPNADDYIEGLELPVWRPLPPHAEGRRRAPHGARRRQVQPSLWPGPGTTVRVSRSMEKHRADVRRPRHRAPVLALLHRRRGGRAQPGSHGLEGCQSYTYASPWPAQLPRLLRRLRLREPRV